MRKLALGILAAFFVTLGLVPLKAASAQPGPTTCNPNIRTGNPACGPDAACRRLGNCGFLMNWLCVDDQATGTADKGLSGSFPCNQCGGTVGQCETRNACNSDAGCPVAGGRCVLGSCTNVCRTNAECLAGEECAGGLCRLSSGHPSSGSSGSSSNPPASNPSPSSGRACTIEGSRAECGAKEICKNQHCQPFGPQCSTDKNCRSGEICLQGQCRAI